ncbi:MAG: hypothetical protein KBG15_05645, partial [Kofleriaceae bacterium]|nr:hypothetical protein [Kofleriaceae bacterium]
MTVSITSVALTALAALAGCQASDFDFATNGFRTDGFSGDPFPIRVDTSTGALLVGFKETGKADDLPQVGLLDIMAPLSVLQQTTGDIQVRATNLTIFGQNRSTGALDVPRAQLGGSIVDINVCADDNCRVGTGAGPVAIAAILGSDNLIGDALRLRFDTSQIFILPNIGPRDNGDRTKLCDAVFASPFRGGGTLLLGSTEIPFSGRRIALTACAAADPRAEIPQGQRGTDLLLIASTAVGPTIIGEAAYRRYQLAHATAPLLETLPVNSAWLPSGLIEGRLGSLPNLTIAATSSEGRGACREAYAHHFLFANNCIGDEEKEDCPCIDADNCGAPALLELNPAGGLRVLIIPDVNPTLQGLRAELRPDQAEVDGILGTEA